MDEFQQQHDWGSFLPSRGAWDVSRASCWCFRLLGFSKHVERVHGSDAVSSSDIVAVSNARNYYDSSANSEEDERSYYSYDGNEEEAEAGEKEGGGEITTISIAEDLLHTLLSFVGKSVRLLVDDYGQCEAVLAKHENLGGDLGLGLSGDIIMELEQQRQHCCQESTTGSNF